ncbi:MAG: hypothetical protein KGJ89_05085 [Patescibacteria group bacterium]|nr:hypothetical protein [Patescibacteria group bacterium]MDE2227296.1 hypothetical protein [Patescibacteria group bacterium]
MPRPQPIVLYQPKDTHLAETFGGIADVLTQDLQKRQTMQAADTMKQSALSALKNLGASQQDIEAISNIKSSPQTLPFFQNLAKASFEASLTKGQQEQQTQNIMQGLEQGLTTTTPQSPIQLNQPSGILQPRTIEQPAQTVAPQKDFMSALAAAMRINPQAAGEMLKQKYAPNPVLEERTAHDIAIENLMQERIEKGGKTGGIKTPLPITDKGWTIGVNAEGVNVASRTVNGQTVTEPYDIKKHGQTEQIAMPQSVKFQKEGVFTNEQASDYAGKIKRGEIAPPQLRETIGGFGTIGQMNLKKIQTELNKIDPKFNFAKYERDWKAEIKLVETLNGPQQARIRQAIQFADSSLNVIDDFTSRWKAGRFPLLNKANLAAAKNGAYGKEAQGIAVGLETQIADLQTDLATLYQAGNSPASDAFKLAAKNLEADWPTDIMKGVSIPLIRKNMQLRNESLNIGAAGVSENSPYAQPTNRDKPLGGGTSNVNSYLKKHGY